MLVIGICVLLNWERIKCFLDNGDFFHCVCGSWDSNMHINEGLQVQEDQLWLYGRGEVSWTFFFHKFILVGYGGNHIVQSKIPVEPYYSVGFFPLSRVSSPPILPVLCYPYSTGLLNCSDEFPSNLFWKKWIITALFTHKLVLKAVGMCWQKKMC